MRDAHLRRLYIVTSVLALAPIWSVRYLPTADGPSHLYNAWLLRELIRGNDLVQRWFAINWSPVPNWSGHAILALLMTIVPPLIAEKLLVTGIVGLFFFAMWIYTSEKACAFLAVPFAYNLLLQAGFYNFCIAFALYFIVVTVWWRRRDRPDAKTIATVALLLIACYFSHPMPAALAVAAIGLLWLLTLRGRPLRSHARHLLAFVPVVALLAWFARAQHGAVGGAHYTAWGLFSYLMRMWVLLTFDPYQEKLGRVLFVLIVALIVVTLARRRWRWNDQDAFMVLTAALVALYSWSPSGALGGSMLLERMALFVVLAPLAWIAPRLPARVTAVFAIVTIAISLGYTAYLVRRYRALDKRVTELVRSAQRIGTDTTVLPLVKDVRPRGSFVPVLAHAFDYAAIERRAVNVANYEAAAGFFPVRYRNDAERGACQRNVDMTTPVDLASYARCAEYVFAWHVTEATPLVTGLDTYYLPVGGTDQGRVYRVRDDRALSR